MSALDPRLNPFRPDLAAKVLEGQVEAERFVEGTGYQVSAGVAPVRKAPAGDAEQLSQALHGAVFTVYEEREGFGWGQMASDSYVGWVDMAALSAPVLETTHRVKALRTYVFSAPNLKSAPHFLLSLNAEITAEGEDGRFTKAARAGWVFTGHLGPKTALETDPVDVALRFLNTPYQWGGVESLGLDCSGLLQMAHRACGIAAPRDSDMFRTIGAPVAISADHSGYRRGDIICWKGHVGIMADEAMLLHANGFHMATVLEPLADVAARIADPNQAGPILTVRRLER
jgi:cell wall-associated NlpC family hydrolase